MKKRIGICLAICLLLSGCGAVPAEPVASVSPAPVAAVTEPIAQSAPTAPAAAPQVKEAAGGTAAYRIAPSVNPESQAYYDSLNRETEVFRAYDAVMNANAKMTHGETGDTGSLASMLKRYTDYETPTIRQMTVVDLDRDGVLELILWMQTSADDSYGWLLLSCSDGMVYCKRMDDSYFRELKIDGSFALGENTYARLPDSTGLTPPQVYSEEPASHEAKADVIWYSQWLNLIYPGASSDYTPIVGVLDEDTQLTDIHRQERIRLEDVGQLLMPQEVKTRIVQCTAIDLDWDGVVETIVQIGTETDDYVGFVVLRQDNEQYLGQGYYYRTFFELRTDGTYAFSSGASDSGYGMLTFQNGQWMETVLAKTYETITESGNAHQLYFVGGEMTTKEAYDRFVQKQDAKQLQTWYSSLSEIPN